MRIRKTLYLFILMFILVEELMILLVLQLEVMVGQIHLGTLTLPDG